MRERLHGMLLAGLLGLATGAAGATELDDAIAAYQRGDHAQAVPTLTSAAEQGDPLAQVYLGLAYYNGHGVEENDIVAFTWFWRAAEQGDAEGQYQLAYMYTYGFGIPEGEPDPEGKAVEWYERAAQQGHAGHGGHQPGCQQADRIGQRIGNRILEPGDLARLVQRAPKRVLH